MASRIVLLLTALLVAVMPVTEHYWRWDQSLRSGHDLEFTLLGMLLFCGMVALIADQVVVTPLLLLLTAYDNARPVPWAGCLDLARPASRITAFDCRPPHPGAGSAPSPLRI